MNLSIFTQPHHCFCCLRLWGESVERVEAGGSWRAESPFLSFLIFFVFYLSRQSRWKLVKHCCVKARRENITNLLCWEKIPDMPGMSSHNVTIIKQFSIAPNQTINFQTWQKVSEISSMCFPSNPISSSYNDLNALCLDSLNRFCW